MSQIENSVFTLKKLEAFKQILLIQSRYLEFKTNCIYMVFVCMLISLGIHYFSAEHRTYWIIAYTPILLMIVTVLIKKNQYLNQTENIVHSSDKNGFTLNEKHLIDCALNRIKKKTKVFTYSSAIFWAVEFMLFAHIHLQSSEHYLFLQNTVFGVGVMFTLSSLFILVNNHEDYKSTQILHSAMMKDFAN